MRRMPIAKRQTVPALIESLERRDLFSHFVNGSRSYTDATFLAKNWTTIPVVTGGGGVSSAVQVKKGGHPGAYQAVTNSVSGSSSGSELFTFVENLKATYVPAKSGAITSITYREDNILISGFGQGERTGPALEQDGQTYFLLDQTLDTPFDIWTRVKVTSLTAADFSTLDGSAHPDFSQTADPIQFGYYRANSAGSSGYTIVAGMDNWLTTVKTRKQVK
jgi:hypothetical protein